MAQETGGAVTRRVLITGGAGFIGFHLATHLARDPGVHVVLADNMQRGRFDAELETLLNRPNVELVEVDLTSPLEHVRGTTTYRVLPRDFDDVYHLAAVNGTKHFYEHPELVLRTNTLATVHLLDWIRRWEFKPRLMFASSNEAYAGGPAAFEKLIDIAGGDPYGVWPYPTPEGVPLIVSDTYNPRWSYGASKLIGEMFVVHYAKAFGIPSVIVRPHNFYGPRAGYDHVIPEMIGRIEARQDPFPVPGAQDTRAFCYIDDAVEAMVRLMDHAFIEQAPTVNIGSSDEICMGSLARALFRIASWHPMDARTLPTAPGSVARRLPDVSLVKNLTGWQAATELMVGLRETLAWYRRNPKPSSST